MSVRSSSGAWRFRRELHLGEHVEEFLATVAGGRGVAFFGAGASIHLRSKLGLGDALALQVEAGHLGIGDAGEVGDFSSFVAAGALQGWRGGRFRAHALGLGFLVGLGLEAGLFAGGFGGPWPRRRLVRPAGARRVSRALFG